VWVTTSVHPQSAVLTVENTGEKLTPQFVATLVEPFLRGTERIRTDHAGAGLGLAIVKSITQAHDGTSPSPPEPPAGSASGCNYPPRHRTRKEWVDGSSP
jgi:two-component system sensor histidine kinase VanS